MSPELRSGACAQSFCSLNSRCEIPLSKKSACVLSDGRLNENQRLISATSHISNKEMDVKMCARFMQVLCVSTLLFLKSTVHNSLKNHSGLPLTRQKKTGRTLSLYPDQSLNPKRSWHQRSHAKVTKPLDITKNGHVCITSHMYASPPTCMLSIVDVIFVATKTLKAWCETSPRLMPFL